MPDSAPPKRGEIYWVDFSPGRGSEQRGLRPALVVSNDTGNDSGPTVIVAVLTTTDFRKPYPFVVAVAAGEGGCPRASFVNCAQLLTITKARLGTRLGALGEERMSKVEAALRYELAL